MAEFDITTHHPDYDANAQAWHTMRDCIDGEDAIKEKEESYLPMKSGVKAISDTTKRKDAYEAYVCRAEFPEIVAPTIRGSMGLIHSKDSVIELPKALEGLEEKATRDGLTLDQFHRRITAELLRMGRYGILPGVNANGDFHLAGYTAETIVNWDAPEGPLTYAVLDESTGERDPDTNKWERKKRFRECYLNDRGGFVSRVWEKEGTEQDGKDKYVAGEEEIATIRGRDLVGMVPLVIAGTMDLTPEPDDIPMYGLAKLALRAYRLDADYVTSLHMTSEPTPYVTGVEQESAPKTIGAGSLWVLGPENAKAGYLEFSGPGLASQEKAIQNTLERAVMFGAQLFADNKRTAESGEALRLRLGSQTSTLKMVAVSSAMALEKSLKYAAIWAGANPDEVNVEPNLDFIDHELTPQDIMALVSGWQSGAYSKLTLFENMQRGGVVDPGRTFEEEQDLIAGDGSALGMMDGDGQRESA